MTWPDASLFGPPGHTKPSTSFLFWSSQFFRFATLGHVHWPVDASKCSPFAHFVSLCSPSSHMKNKSQIVSSGCGKTPFFLGQYSLVGFGVSKRLKINQKLYTPDMNETLRNDNFKLSFLLIQNSRSSVRLPQSTLKYWSHFPALVRFTLNTSPSEHSTSSAIPSLQS